MKKLFVLLIAVLLVYGFTVAHSSGIKTSDWSKSGRTYLAGVYLESQAPSQDTTASLVVYNGTSPSGVEVYRKTLTMATDKSGVYDPMPGGIFCPNGLYAHVASNGSGVNFIVHYYK